MQVNDTVDPRQQDQTHSFFLVANDQWKARHNDEVAFNAFNHTQFYGPASVDGQVEDPNFGHIVSAAAPRLVQLVAKFTF